MSVDYRPDYDPADVDSDYGHTGGDITVPTFTANMKPFRFWCQKALPLVYDDSLSYYEVLCKVVKQMNDFLTDLQTATGAIDQFAQQFVINQQFLNDMADQLGQNVQDLETYINERMTDFMTAYTQLQDYVNNYFDNLDVQQEINNKLDEMASDGTFNDLFDPVITAWMTAKTAQIDAAIAGQDAIQAQQNGRISVLESRMDTFDGLPAGSTAGNAELIGIRTNFLGEVYPTAGDAVRSSDMIASGFESIPFTRLEEWNGNEESTVYDTIQFDVSAYKGGRAIMIANMEGFVDSSQMIGVAVYATNIAGKNVDPSPHYYALGSNIFTNYSVIPTQIQGEERIALYFSIPDDFSYQYLKMGFVERIPVQEYTHPAAIVYATSWSKTKVDPTLTNAGEAADAKATGDALDELNERMGNVGNELDQINLDWFMPKSNIFNYVTAKSGYTLKTDGTKNETETGYTSDWIKVEPSTEYYQRHVFGSNIIANAVFYTSDKEFISAVNGSSNTYTTPATCAYMKVCGYTSNIGSQIVNKGSTMGTAEPFIGILSPASGGGDYAKLISDGNIVFDKDNGQLSVINGSNNINVYIPGIGNVATISTPVTLSDNSGSILYFDKSSNTFFSSNRVLVGDNIGQNIYRLGELSKSGIKNSNEEPFIIAKSAPVIEFDLIHNVAHVSIKSSTYFWIDGTYSAITAEDYDIQLGSNISCIFFNTLTKKFIATTSFGTYRRNPVYIQIAERYGAQVQSVIPYSVTSVDKKLAYKKINTYGDSLTWYDGKEFNWGPYEGDICYGYQSYLANYLGATVYNKGASGKTTPQIDGIIESDSSLSNVDYVIIMPSIMNDDRLGVLPGTVQPIGGTFDTSTTAGALQSAIEHIYSVNQAVRIVIIVEPQGFTYVGNNYPKLCNELIPVAIRNVAKLYGLPCIDLWNESGINELTRNSFYADPSFESGNHLYMYHPNNLGWSIISRIICDAMGAY